MLNNPLAALPASYRSVELSPQGPVLITHRLPDLRRSDVVVVRPHLVGICRSDIKEVQGNRQVRKDFGHEIAGTVEWVGPSMLYSVGDLVCFDPHVPISRTSGFADLIIAEALPSPSGKAFLKAGKGMTLEQVMFCEPMACAQHCVSNLLRYTSRSRLDGLRVGVVGAGNAGTLIGLIARYLGAQVTLFNRSSDRLALLENRRIFSGGELRYVDADTADAFDVMIPATDFLHSPILEFSIRAVRADGLLLLYGGTQQDTVLPVTSLPIDPVRRYEQLVDVTGDNKRFRLGGTYGALERDFSRVMSLLHSASNSFPVEHLITEEIPLTDLPEKLKSLADPEVRYRGKIAVRW